MSGDDVTAGFARYFGLAAQAADAAPGRVNLLGEHTDYNDGFVLPTPIAAQTHVALAVAPDDVRRCSSAQCPDGADFGRYVFGCLDAAAERRLQAPAVWVYVDSVVPIGAGLSSSAALEVATLRALRQAFRWALDDVELARTAQRAEVRYAGVNCGIMDQMAASVGRAGALLFLDTRSLEHRLVPMPHDSELLVLDSGERRALASSGYNTRRAECAAAARALGVPALRDITDPSLCRRLEPPLDRRARHVITENARVLEAVRTADPHRFGTLMNDSHASLRDDFEVSTPALDCLTRLLRQQPAVHGARLTGAGFGGACVALVAPGECSHVAESTLAAYSAAGYRGRRLV